MRNASRLLSLLLLFIFVNSRAIYRPRPGQDPHRRAAFSHRFVSGVYRAGERLL